MWCVTGKRLTNEETNVRRSWEGYFVPPPLLSLLQCYRLKLALCPSLYHICKTLAVFIPDLVTSSVVMESLLFHPKGSAHILLPLSCVCVCVCVCLGTLLRIVAVGGASSGRLVAKLQPYALLVQNTIVWTKSGWIFLCAPCETLACSKIHPPRVGGCGVVVVSWGLAAWKSQTHSPVSWLVNTLGTLLVFHVWFEGTAGV